MFRLNLRPRLSLQAKERKIPQAASGEPGSRAAGMREAIVLHRNPTTAELRGGGKPSLPPLNRQNPYTKKLFGE